MNANRDQQEKPLVDFKESCRTGLGLMAMLGTGAEVWLAGRFGCRYLHPMCIVGALIGPGLFLAFDPPRHADWDTARRVGGIIQILYLMHIGMTLVQVVASRRSRAHDHEMGDTMWRPGRGRRAGEELLVGCLIGAATHPLIPAYGAYMIASSVANAMGVRLIQHRDARRIKRMRDARLEAERLREMYEDVYGD